MEIGIHRIKFTRRDVMTFGGVNFQMASVVVSLPNDPNRLGMT